VSGRLIVAVVAVCVLVTAVGPALILRRPPPPKHRYGPRPLIDRRAAGQPRRRRRR
jgi:hypothetical protein